MFLPGRCCCSPSQYCIGFFILSENWLGYATVSEIIIVCLFLEIKKPSGGLPDGGEELLDYLLRMPPPREEETERGAEKERIGADVRGETVEREGAE